MDIQQIYDEKIKLKFEIKSEPDLIIDDFSYIFYENGDADLFLLDKGELFSFLDWNFELMPEDPYYTHNSKAPLLVEFFPKIDIYDEIIFYYLLYTINSITSIVKETSYTKMNVFMKDYSFFQLSKLTKCGKVNRLDEELLRKIFFDSFLYSHPVNEETLCAFHFEKGDLTHIKTGVRVYDYFSKYYDFYYNNYQTYADSLEVSQDGLMKFKKISLELLKIIEGKSYELTYPNINKSISIYLNGDFENIKYHFHDDNEFYKKLVNFFEVVSLSDKIYDKHLIDILLQNYAFYSLRYDFNNINNLIQYFEVNHNNDSCSLIINKIFSDTIFLKKIIKYKNIDILSYKKVIPFFTENTRKIIFNSM